MTSSQPSTSSQLCMNKKVGHTSDYLSIADIQSEATKITVRFLQTVPKLGFIDPSSECTDIEKGSKLELPLWLAKELYHRQLIEIDVPKGYNIAYREILEADANVVDLHKLGPNFYKVGQHLANMKLPESEDIAKSLVSTFSQRVHRLLDFSMNATDDTMNEVLRYEALLDNDERELFNAGRQATEEVKKWENRTIDKLTANEMVTNLRKRKRIIMENN